MQNWNITTTDTGALTVHALYKRIWDSLASYDPLVRLVFKSDGITVSCGLKYIGYDYSQRELGVLLTTSHSSPVNGMKKTLACLNDLQWVWTESPYGLPIRFFLENPDGTSDEVRFVSVNTPIDSPEVEFVFLDLKH